MRVESGIVSVVPLELQGVQSYRVKLDRPDRIGDGTGLEPFLSRPLVDTICARATLAEQLDGVGGLVSVGPGNPHSGFVYLADVFGEGSSFESVVSTAMSRFSR